MNLDKAITILEQERDKCEEHIAVCDPALWNIYEQHLSMFSDVISVALAKSNRTLHETKWNEKDVDNAIRELDQLQYRTEQGVRELFGIFGSKESLDALITVLEHIKTMDGPKLYHVSFNDHYDNQAFVVPGYRKTDVILYVENMFEDVTCLTVTEINRVDGYQVHLTKN